MPETRAVNKLGILEETHLRDTLSEYLAISFIFPARRTNKTFFTPKSQIKYNRKTHKITKSVNLIICTRKIICEREKGG